MTAARRPPHDHVTTASHVVAAIRATPPRLPDSDAQYAITTAVAEMFGVAPNVLCGKTGNRKALAAPRQVAMALVRANTALSLPAIGRMFDRDHSTVRHAIQRVLEQDDLRAYAAAAQQLIDQEAKTP